MNKLLMAIGIRLRDRIKQRIRNGEIVPETTGKRSGRTLYTRGHLARSIKYRMEGNKIYLTAGDTSVPYARIQHEGGTIVPKTSKYLAIPLTAKAKLYKPRQFPEATFIAKGYIFSKQGDKPVAQYKLVKSVTIPARPYLYVGPNDMKQIDELVREYVHQSVRRKDAS